MTNLSSISSNSRPTEEMNGAKHINDKERRSRLHYSVKLAQTILLSPLTRTVTLAVRTVKLLTWVPAKAGLYKVTGRHTESADYFEGEYLKTVKVVRDILFLPSVMKRAFQDMVASREEFVDDIKRKSPEEYLNVENNKSTHFFSSYLHGIEPFQIIHPEGITEFAATTDASLKTIMASHLFKPGMMAINFGCPNVAAFVTEKNDDGSVGTVKVDAKSLRRAPMSYHNTNGKIQSGVFLVPTNLPTEALDRFKEAAQKLDGRSDFTCVNTNCRVLKEAGFSIEGVALDEVIFPITLMEHLLFRNVFYTDSEGVKHKVHFDIVKTTKQNLEEYAETIDTAVVGTRLRHNRRNSDTEENQQARGLAAKHLIEEEASRLKASSAQRKIDEGQDQRKVNISVPSYIGNIAARIWGRHTIYEVDLSDKSEEISQAFSAWPKLRPFPQEKPSFATRLKRDIFFARPVIWFLRGHIMGRVDTIHLHTQGLFEYLKASDGARLNYALLDNKVVLARVEAIGTNGQLHKKAADWALSKHALLADRQDVYCSGEMWYDRTSQRFILNDDSGTYKPSFEQVEVVAKLANDIFRTEHSDYSFEAVTANEEIVA